MRLAVVSDIHGNLPALEAVLHEIEAAGVDLTVNLGDILSGPLWPVETADRLMALELPTIAGNHERQVLTHAPERMHPSDAFAAARLTDSQRAWLASLPATRWLEPDVLCCHGTPTDDLQYLLETVVPESQPNAPGMRLATRAELRERLGDVSATLVLCGHSHVARSVQCGSTLVVNPGSVGLQAYDDPHPHPHHAQAGSPHARWALAERVGAGHWRVAHRVTPYDWMSAAERAAANGREDWAHALRSGYAHGLEAAS